MFYPNKAISSERRRELRTERTKLEHDDKRPDKVANRSRSTNIQAEYAVEPHHAPYRRNTLAPAILKRKLASMGPAQRSRLLSEHGDPADMDRRGQEKFLKQSKKRRYN